MDAADDADSDGVCGDEDNCAHGAANELDGDNVCSNDELCAQHDTGCVLLHTAAYRYCCVLLRTAAYCCVLRTAAYCCVLLRTAAYCCVLLRTWTRGF